MIMQLGDLQPEVEAAKGPEGSRVEHHRDSHNHQDQPAETAASGAPILGPALGGIPRVTRINAHASASL